MRSNSRCSSCRQQGVDGFRPRVEPLFDRSQRQGAAQPGEGGREGRGQPVRAEQHRVAGTDHRQREKLAVIARQPGQQPRPHERGFAGAGGAEDHQQALDAVPAHVPQRFHAVQDLRVAPEEHRRIGRVQRLQSAVRGPVGIVGGRPGEVLGADAGLLQAVLQALQSAGQERTGRGLFPELEAERGLGALAVERAPLPIGRQVLPIAGFDDGQKHLLAQRFRIPEFELAFGRGQPRGRHQAQHRLAAVGRAPERVLPALAGAETIPGIDIEKHVVPAVVGQPLLQRDRFQGILAVVTEKDARHPNTPLATQSPELCRSGWDA